MNRKNAEEYVMEFAKPIYGFALKRCACLQDAEDLSQEILLKAFSALQKRDDIVDISKYIWTIAHNTLNNYYRSGGSLFSEVPIQSHQNIAATSGAEPADQLIFDETTAILYREIAYLSSLQRKIVIAFYFENQKQTQIAENFGIPLGTVKWHLFEAKKELKKGLERMNELNTLAFNPIHFSICGTNGSVGAKGNNRNFLRSALSQNIAYVTYRSGKTINEIAEILNVSPVFVESEVNYLTDYCFLTKDGNKYFSSVLIDEPTGEIVAKHDEMYTSAAKLFANELFDQLERTEFIRHSDMDFNFLMWSVIPYIAALSGEAIMDTSISFNEVATIRPDGGVNICYATVSAPNAPSPKYDESIKQWNGPCWNANDNLLLWQIDSEWSECRIDENYPVRIQHDLSLLVRYQDGTLSADEYAHLAERGYIKIYTDKNGTINYCPAVLWLDREISTQLLQIGTQIKTKYQDTLAKLKAPYVEAMLSATPTRLHKVRLYGMENIFYSDGWFILHCIKELLQSGKLTPPTEEQRRALTTIICEQ